MKVTVEELASNAQRFSVGQRIYLSGIIYTARDAAHKRIVDILDQGEKPPFDLKNSAIYYCGPAPSKPDAIIGACGPTTSSRMDSFTPRMISEGVKILIGKGSRNKETAAAIASCKAIYLVATGGIAALLSKTVKQARIIAFEDLGTEAVYELKVEDMPLIVAIDCNGKNIFA
ncbi:MAG: FumA C-terminus/TtdB family hydratase beta subunit [Elusimicrobiota bacterium]|jgi:fumarate hydratase subunit beta|nr:FumA C-terminus/TtdB family hydratase beta subunit [Elusimicrobiota bacterium]